MEKTTQSPEPGALSRTLAAFANILAVLWRFFANPWLLLALCICALILVLVAMAVPQMPDPLNTDPAAASRWLLNTTAAYTTTGNLLESLGLFNLLHSDLLRVLLVLIALMLAVQFADQLGLAFSFRRLPRRFETPVGKAGLAVPLVYGDVVHRIREASAVDVDRLIQLMQDALADRFNRVQRAVVERSSGDDLDPATDNDTSKEERLLAVRNQGAAYLRPLLLLGLLFGLAGLWLNVTFGWEFISPSLPPLERHPYPLRDLVLHYPAMEGDAAGATPFVQVYLGDMQKSVAVGDATLAGQTRITVRPSVPALLVRAETADLLLARFGDSTKASALGLEFPEPGREELLVLPDQAMGIRILRQFDNRYDIEFYEDGSTTPVETFSLDEGGSRQQDLPGNDATLTFISTVGAVASVRSQPGDRLYWLAGLLIVVGLAGFVRNPVFLLAQTGTWSPSKTVLVAQSNASAELATLRGQVESSDAED